MPSARKPDNTFNSRLTLSDNTVSISLNTSYLELSDTTSKICCVLSAPAP